MYPFDPFSSFCDPIFLSLEAAEERPNPACLGAEGEGALGLEERAEDHNIHNDKKKEGIGPSVSRRVVSLISPPVCVIQGSRKFAQEDRKQAAKDHGGTDMRIVRFLADKRARYGILDEQDEIQPLEAPPFECLIPGKERFRLADVDLLAPCEPSKVVGIGLNYRDHAEEVGLDLPKEPMLFLMPNTAVIGPGQKIRFPEMSKRVDYEGELGIVIGRRAFRIRREAAGEHILGYTCFNDVTARDLQILDTQFTRSKGFDTFAPMGPWIVTDLDPRALDIETYLNRVRKQCSNTRQLVFDPFHLVHFVSWVMTLNPGDVIASGTPSGIGPMEPGDRVEIRIQGIGSLVNEVAPWEDGPAAP